MVENQNKKDHNEGVGVPSAAEVLPRCPVVGIGASAGGVKALQTLFEALPDQLDAAFVVIVHLDPNRQSELASILAGRTSMAVEQVSESMELEPNRVYVIPPNRRLVISDHEISTAEFDEPRGKRLPIDQFFRSMAEHRGDGVAIVLTGSGSDGAIGIKAVKEAGGVILVQEPTDAEYSSMPGSAIATGFADFVLPVSGIAARLVELLRSKEHIRSPNSGLDDEQTVSRILGQLRARTGHDFGGYKRSTVLRRLARRMQIVKAERLQDYLKYVHENVEESQSLFSDLLISVTAFFRDPGAFGVLASEIIPRIFDGRDDGDCVRAWVPGCATGEEAYSIAMLLIEERARRDQHFDIQVFASDLDLGALATAREGRYPPAIEADISEERLHQFFFREGDHYRVKRELRDVVLFATHSLLRDAPFSKLDLVSCRNLLIYLDRDLQRQACDILAYGLLPGGYLFLGPSEGVDSGLRSVRTIDRQARIFQITERRPLIMPGFSKSDPKLAFLQPVAPAHREHHRSGGPDSHLQTLEELAPPSVLVDDNHRIINVSESAGRYLLHPGGPPTTDVTELVRPELRLDLRAGLHRAFDKNEASLSLSIPVQFDGTARQVHIQVRPQKAEAHPRRALVLFIEGEFVNEPAASGSHADAAQDAGPLRQLREELNSMRVRLGDSRQQYGEAIEELRAANEELQSTNEEYRSTAEELETSKEELQSTNEELQTINNELKLKVESLARAYGDIQNLITSADVGTLFLDRGLRIKRFTPRIADLFNIAESDEGRSITDFTHRLQYDALAADAQLTLDRLTPIDNEVRTRDGHWFLARLRPYRSTEDKIEGVVITFVDVTERRGAEEALRQSQQRLESELSATQQLHRISTELIHEQRTESLYDKLVEAAAVVMGSEYASMQMLYPERGSGGELRLLASRGFNSQAARFWEWVRVDSKSTCGVALRTGHRVTVPDVLQCNFMTGTEDLETYLQTGIHAVQTTPLISRSGRMLGMISTHWHEPHEPRETDLRLLDLLARQAADFIERAEAEAALRESEERFRTMSDNIAQLAWTCDQLGDVTWYNKRWLDYTGLTLEEMKGWGWKEVQHPDHVDRVVTSVAHSRNVDEVWEDTFPLRAKDGTYRWFLSRAVPTCDAAGNVVRWFGTNTDISDLRDADTRQQLLVNELNHRVKNTLATVQAIAAQTFRGSDIDPKLPEAFEARLIALSNAHSLLTESNWEGAEIGDVVRRTVELQAAPDRIQAHGPSIRLSPKAALAIAMAMHELATNAAKYGALSNGTGQVAVIWSVDGPRPGTLNLQWAEKGGPSVKKPTRKGFGSRMIERNLSHDLNGQARIDYRPEGVICTIMSPLE